MQQKQLLSVAAAENVHREENKKASTGWTYNLLTWILPLYQHAIQGNEKQKFLSFNDKIIQGLITKKLQTTQLQVNHETIRGQSWNIARTEHTKLSAVQDSFHLFRPTTLATIVLKIMQKAGARNLVKL